MAVTRACNSGKTTLDTGQRPGKTDEQREANRSKDSMIGVTGGGVCQVYCCTQARWIKQCINIHGLSQREEHAVCQTMDKHVAVPAVDISGSSAWWLTARGASLQLVRRLQRVAAKRDPANMGEVRSLSFITWLSLCLI